MNGSQITEVIQYSGRAKNEGNKFFIPKINFETEYIDRKEFTTSQVYIQIIKCRPELLKFNEVCASEEISNRFFEQLLNAIAIQITFNQINSKNGEVQTSAQDFYYSIEEPKCYTLNVCRGFVSKYWIYCICTFYDEIYHHYYQLILSYLDSDKWILFLDLLKLKNNYVDVIILELNLISFLLRIVNLIQDQNLVLVKNLKMVVGCQLMMM